jgi:hypothetical protein
VEGEEMIAQCSEYLESTNQALMQNPFFDELI